MSNSFLFYIFSIQKNKNFEKNRLKSDLQIIYGCRK